nr:hypothetical protein Itr_chr08CG19520 [Ipomoea trifida]
METSFFNVPVMETSFFNVPSNHRSRTAPSSLRISPVGGKQHDAPAIAWCSAIGDVNKLLVSLHRRTVATPLFSPVFSGELVTTVEAASGDDDPSFLFDVCKSIRRRRRGAMQSNNGEEEE